MGDLLSKRNAYVLCLSVIGLLIIARSMPVITLTLHDMVPLQHNRKHLLQSRD